MSNASRSDEAIVQAAVHEVIVKPHKILFNKDQAIDTFCNRLRTRLQELLDAGELAAGEYHPKVQIGLTATVSVRVCAQADLFGPASLNIDTAGLRDLLESLRQA